MAVIGLNEGVSWRNDLQRRCNLFKRGCVLGNITIVTLTVVGLFYISVFFTWVNIRYG